MMKEIIKDGIILAKHIRASEWEQGLKFYSNDDEFIQVGTWNYDANKELLAHAHNEVERKVYWTQEVLYIKQGSISAKIYDIYDSFVEELIAKEGDVLILLRGGHGYTILEDNTQVLEIKNGPYVGADNDRRRI
ncbi:hypothetical protein L8U00_01065 [Campylobacter sp. IFREMER_LSEM_CL2256]|uniref:hypothetical protein n=1 Tax=Campylobacter sp. IFREMER_LSEM_CL2256 TaxID=2911622 RepID=UPI0021E902C3|nr:hypothetical protein [Campylobacter sp. IFREMER_LSEM_CL2256]MCV3387079.1 hypothetical protein [Campylobacter sp. IFREMER_LSEM_CL2256]